MALDPVEIVGGIAIGTGLGGAISDTVEPRLRQFKFAQSSKYLYIPLNAATAAEVAAEDVAAYPAMEAEAAQTGYDSTRFANLYGVTLNAPGTGDLLAMLRRGTINQGNFEHGLHKARFEPMWTAPMLDLANQKLSAADIAYMVVRGVLPDDGMLGQTLPSSADNLNLPPQLALDPVAEAALTGWDKQRLRALIGRSGLAMAPVMAAQARFRGILTQNDYELTIARGDLYPAYAAPVLEASRQILTSGEYAELQLRGYLTEAERRAHTAKHGMTEADSDLLYDVLGRGVNVHQVLIGERRGGVFNGPTDAIPPAYLYALQRGNLRPEVYNLAYAARETYPSYFVTRALLQAGVITAQRGQELFDGLGWPADVAKAAGTFFAGGTTAGADPHVTKAQNQHWTALHSSYVKDRTDDATALQHLTTIGVAGTAQQDVLAQWRGERDLIRAGLSPAQIKKSYYEAKFTQAEAVTRLVELGWSVADANDLLSL